MARPRKPKSKPVYDDRGRQVGQVASSVAIYKGLLLAECPKDHLYQLPATTIKWGMGDRCPVCRQPIEPASEEV